MKNFAKKIISSLKKGKNITQKPIIIVDIGCRWGFADKFMLDNDSDNLKIYGFDPDVDECTRLEKVYTNSNIKLVPVGLDATPGKRTLYLTKEPACSSLYKPNKDLTESYPALDCAKEVSQIEVEVSTLDIWAKEIDLDYIDYIKIDTQGAELNILKGASGILPTVRFLEIEVEFNPIYDGQPTFSEVDLFLRSFDFVLWKFSNIVHYSKENESDIVLGKESINYDNHRLEYEVRGGQIYWADAFYIRKEIVNTTYNLESKGQILRDLNIAKKLGFLDLKERLERFYNSMEE